MKNDQRGGIMKARLSKAFPGGAVLLLLSKIFIFFEIH
jgi:hypothetical protein